MKSILSKFVFPLAFALVCFFVGYGLGGRIGDSRGYDSGFKDGYRYDCREEIANLYDQVKALSKTLDLTKTNLTSKAFENDSLRWEIRRKELKANGDPKGDLSLREMIERQQRFNDEFVYPLMNRVPSIKPAKELKSGGKK